MPTVWRSPSPQGAVATSPGPGGAPPATARCWLSRIVRPNRVRRPLVSSAAENRTLIEGFWADLYRQDFASLVSRFHPDGEYTDVVTPDDDVARGPLEITAAADARLREADRALRRTAPSGRGRRRGHDRAHRALGMADRGEHGAGRRVGARDQCRTHRPVVRLLGHECPHASGAGLVVRARHAGVEVGHPASPRSPGPSCGPGISSTRASARWPRPAGGRPRPSGSNSRM